jgi:Predicted membrane protein
MFAFGAERARNETILVARLVLTTMFLVYGWGKLTDYASTAAYMAQVGAPAPFMAALVAIMVEVFVALATLSASVRARWLFCWRVYTLGTGLIGHPFWMTEGAARYMDAINFYKNISIIGGCLLL